MLIYKYKHYFLFNQFSRYSGAFSKQEDTTQTNDAVASTSNVADAENDLVSHHSYDPSLSISDPSDNASNIDPKDHILKAQESVVSLSKEQAAHSEKYHEKYLFSWFFHMFTLK